MGLAVLARGGGALCAALGLALVALLFGAGAASADIEFCPPGEGAGECALPANLSAQRGLALDQQNGHLYVADQANNRVDVFTEDGDFLFAFGWGVDTGAPELQTCTTASGCQKGIAGPGPGQLDRPTKVAVDNDPTSPNQGFVYVVDPPNSRVSLFDPTSPPVKFIRSIGSEGEGPGQFSSRISIGVGPGGVLHVLDNLPLGGLKFKHRLQRFQPNGEPVLPPPPAECILFEGGPAESLAVASSGELWVASAGEGQGVRKYGASCAELLLAEDSQGIATTHLALDGADNLFTTRREVRDEVPGAFQVITAHDPATGGIVSRFAYGRIPSSNPEGLAVRFGSGGGIFVAVREEGSAKRIRRLDFPPPPNTLPSPGPTPAPPSLEVEDLGSTKATLVAEVNPEGKATTVHFEYLTQAEYEAQGNSFTGPATKSTAPKPLGAEAFRLKTVEDLAGCPNPAGEAGQPGNECLTPETTYRWRVVASNADNPTGAGESTAEGPPFITNESLEIGEIWATRVGTDTARLHAEVNPNAIPATGFFEYVDDATFKASGFAAAVKAPDVDEGQAPLDLGAGEAFTTHSIAVFPLAPGTVYHFRLLAENPLIAPKASDAEELRTFEAPEAEQCPANQASRIGPGAFLPDCRAYEMVSPLDKADGDIRVLKADLGVPAVREQSSLTGEKLAYGSVRSFGDAASAPYTSQYIARRIAGVGWETHSINSPRGRPIFQGIVQFDIEFRFLSPDLCEAWQTTFSEPPLAAGALAGYSNLYRRTDQLCSEDGEAHYQTLAPIVEPPGIPPSTFLMEPLGVSAEGEHAVFEANGVLAAGGSEGEHQLYESVGGAAPRFVCRLPGGEAVSGSCTAGSAAPAGLPGTQSGRISSEGERVFWSAPNGGEGKLYVRIGGAQTVAVSQGGEEASGTSASWFWGAASDGSVAIFSTLHPEAGVSDLYEFDVEGEASEPSEPIAEGVVGVMGMSEDASRLYFASNEVLSEGANSNGDKAQAGKANLYLREGDGSVRFVARLAGADLDQAVSREPYLVRTSRVSPDGAHAAFVSVAPLTGYDNLGAQSGTPTPQVYRYDAEEDELSCVSCNPSGARPADGSSIPPWRSPMHAARVLVDDGDRLYFESADTLAARDSNGRADVYQWEESGAGGCDEADAAFSAAAGGCVELISSGQSPQDSRFVESSSTGDDVFFATVASLLPQDFGVFDIYDARVGGGLPVPIPPKPPCEGDTCHAQVAAPEEPTPASSDYVAPPQAAESKPARRRCAKGKRRVSSKGKSRCVAKGKSKRRRAAL